jgi:hypothetical protein
LLFILFIDKLTTLFLDFFQITILPSVTEQQQVQSYPPAPPPSGVLLEELVRRRISVAELGAAAGVGPPVIQSLLRSKARFSTRAGVRIALALSFNHRHLLLAQARHDTCNIARILTPIDGPIRRAPVVCEIPQPDQSTLGALFTYELRRRRITLGLAARMAGLNRGIVQSLVTTTAPTPSKRYAAVKLAQLFQLPLDHFMLIDAAHKADVALAAIYGIPTAEDLPRPARSDKGMHEAHIRRLKIHINL